jgi:GNAT superfamily N-acetyltransferase
MAVTTRVATQDDRIRVREFYRQFDYAQHIHPEDTFVIAAQNGEICAALRLAVENGVLLLRGMRVAASHRRQGIGTQLLGAAAPVIGGRECFCIPHRYLILFYNQIGFVEIEPAQAPEFLRQRIVEYRENLGLDVVLMRLPPRLSLSRK